MKASAATKKLRIEINLTNQQSLIIRKLICRIGETRKEAIQRLITAAVDKAVVKQGNFL